MRPFVFILFFLFSRQTLAQEFKYLVRFRDKNNNGYTLSDPSSFLSGKSIQRRTKYKIGIDSTDLPLTAAYIDSLAGFPAVRILNKSRWFNQTLISVSDTGILQEIKRFPFVFSAESVNNGRVKKIKEKISVNLRREFNQTTGSYNGSHLSGLTPAEYGASYSQIHIHHGEFLHSLGFRGEGMTIAILDNGFNNYLSNPAFDSIRLDNRILGTYDFVNQKTSVNEEGAHGGNCFSIIASNIPKTLIGSSPAASYWLFKTEDDQSESPIEEQNWIAAAEFADSVGVDLITTSLGYAYFDDPVYDLNYPERDGHTALVTRAANLAVAKGMIVTASAGNSGSELNEKKYIVCPADGDSVYAVGAVDGTGQIGNFSSWGPNSSDQVKPDGVSLGVGSFLIGNDGNLYSGNGTSYANPNLAGLITCLWQAFPEFNSKEILSAVIMSSDKFSNPDDRYGYGLPDFEKAYQQLLSKKLSHSNLLTEEEWIRVFPVPFNQTIQVYFRPSLSGEAGIELLNVSGKTILKQKFSITENVNQLAELHISGVLAKGVYFIRYSDADRSKTIKVLKD